MKKEYFLILPTLLVLILLFACENVPLQSIETRESEVDLQPVETIIPDADIEVPLPTVALETLPTRSTADVVIKMPDLGGRKITIVTDNAYLPFTYIPLGTSEAAGWDHEVFDIICEMLNCTPVFVQAKWEDTIPGLEEGRYDISAGGVTITKERTEIIDFSIAYINIQQRIMVRADEDRFSGVEGLVTNLDLLVGAQEDTTNEQAAKGLVGPARVKSFPVFPDMIMSLIDGEVDAILVDETAGLGYSGHNADQVKLIGIPLTNNELGFMFTRRSDLVPPFNKALTQLKSDGRLDELTVKYFTEAFTITYDDIDPGAYADE